MNKAVRILFSFLAVFCLAQVAFSATYTVTKIGDTNDGMCDADCSLREAVTAANSTADNDTIAFSTLFNTTQTIVLGLGEIVIANNGSLTINGPGANLLTVDGNNASRVISISDDAIVNIDSMRLTRGNGAGALNNGSGGALSNNGGTTTLTNMIITGSTATNGGGLRNVTGGILTIISSEITNNTTTGSGGGMQNVANTFVTIINTTFTGNVANSAATGGGAIQANGTLNIVNSTFSGNSAPTADGGGIYYNGQGLTMNNVTIANNSATDGGGLYKSTTTNNASIRNTIIAGNTAPANPDVRGNFISLGNNLIGSVGSSTGWISSDLLNSPAFLAPLANNGGFTRTHALQANSPAINAGDNCVVTASCAAGNPPSALTTDQRGAGFPRQVGSAVDIGAFESQFLSQAQAAQFDFDGDGRTDYAVFRPSNTAWYINRSSNNQLLTRQFGLGTDRLVPADYDGDGITDIAVWRGNSGDPERAYFYILQSATGTLRTAQFGKQGDDPRVVNDWDGDGKADPAVFRQGGTGAQSLFFYRPSSQPSVDFVTIYWGTAGDEPVRGDFDGDGRMDAAVYRPSDATWYIRQSPDGQLRAAKWGVNTDIRVPADYDGDGKADLAVFRDGLWAILQSSNGQARYQNFGVAGDALVPGDYDGDGKADLAVYRNNVFYVLRSSSNQLATFQFGTTGDVPVASVYYGQ